MDAAGITIGFKSRFKLRVGGRKQIAEVLIYGCPYILIRVFFRRHLLVPRHHKVWTQSRARLKSESGMRPALARLVA